MTTATRPGVLPLLFGTRTAVDRRSYLFAGVALMALKVAVESLMVWLLEGRLPGPGLLLVPIFSLRKEMAGVGGEKTLLWLAIWSLPFAWIGLSMSVRRAYDAGLPPLLGLLFGVPLLNYGLMAWLGAMPTKRRPAPEPGAAPEAANVTADVLRDAVKGVGLAVLIGAPIVAALAALGGSYGSVVFLTSPFVMGALAGWVAGRERVLKPTQGFLLGVVAVVVAFAILLLFAIEGVICLAMAAPPAVVAGGFGGALGAVWASARSRPLGGAGHVAAIALPLFGLVTELPPAERVVVSEVVVDAPPERVWPVVIAFPEIPAPPEDAWLFRAGVAMPLRARIEGAGVGAVRYCEFTTGPFVEPIRVWDPPHRLAFDVTEQPTPMRELSPFAHVAAPHLVDGTLRSRRGEFELVALPGGRTRLIGRTWYSVAMGPEPYWAQWVERIVHQIHLRVLDHIAVVATAPARPEEALR